jgi:hypothetical protein
VKAPRNNSNPAKINFLQSWWASNLSGELKNFPLFHSGNDRLYPLSAAQNNAQDEITRDASSTLDYQEIYNNYKKEIGKS